MNEDVFTIENRDFFQCYVSFQGCNSSPLRDVTWAQKGSRIIFQPSIFRGELLNFGGVTVYRRCWHDDSIILTSVYSGNSMMEMEGSFYLLDSSWKRPCNILCFGGFDFSVMMGLGQVMIFPVWNLLPSVKDYRLCYMFMSTPFLNIIKNRWKKPIIAKPPQKGTETLQILLTTARFRKNHPKQLQIRVVLLMAEILHHLGCMKPYK